VTGPTSDTTLADQDQVGNIDAKHPRHLRPILRRRTRCAGQTTRRRRGDRRRRHIAPDRPNQLGVDYNAHAIESILKYIAPELGWR